MGLLGKPITNAYVLYKKMNPLVTRWDFMVWLQNQMLGNKLGLEMVQTRGVIGLHEVHLT